MNRGDNERGGARRNGTRRDTVIKPGAPRNGAPRSGAPRNGAPRSGAPRPAPVPAERTGLTIGARRAALDILQDVTQGDAYASLALQKRFSRTPLTPVDRRLAASIVYSTLENQMKLDFALDRLMERPCTDPLTRDILRLSACQILFHDRVPESAAVNEGVNLARAMGIEASCGFINAVLRNLARGKDEIPWPKREDGLTEYLSIAHSMPVWIIERLIADYGEEMAESIVSYRNESHPIAVRPNMHRISDRDFEKLLQKKAWTCGRGTAPHAYLISGASEIALDNDYRSGLFSIQGQASMLAAEAVGAKPGMRVLDACAAPGGKACYIAEAMQGTGRVFAWELHEKRAMLIEAAKRRLRLENIRISIRDAKEHRPDMDGTLDAVLLDAPCSGLGVMLEKPDIKYRVKAEDIPALAQSQRELLNTLCRYVKPGGVLVYSTCSILPDENSRQIAEFIKTHPEFRIEPPPASFPEELLHNQTPLGLQLLPHRDGVEGFYIARMRRGRS